MCEGDLGFYGEPSLGMHAFGALARMVGRVERDVDPVDTREERVGVVVARGEKWG